jgi:hypothetical protein
VGAHKGSILPHAVMHPGPMNGGSVFFALTFSYINITARKWFSMLETIEIRCIMAEASRQHRQFQLAHTSE